MRRGVTLIDLSVTLVLIGVISTVATPKVSAAFDRGHVRAAATEAMAMLTAARRLAIARGEPMTATIDAGTLTVAGAADTVLRRALADMHAVQIEATRPAVTWGVDGMPVTVSNLTLVFTKGRATDTIWVSRLGRVRRSG